MQSATQSTLANLVEEHIISLIREAAVVNRHSKRGGVVSAAVTDDENLAWQAAMAAASGVAGAGVKHTMASSSASASRPRQRRRIIHHDDVNLALYWRGSEKLYVSGAPPCVTPPSSDEEDNKIGKKKGDGSDDNTKKGAAVGNASKASPNSLSQLLANTTKNNINNESSVPSLMQSSTVPRIDLNAYLQSEYSVRPPCELGMTVHWLAVDGVSPMTPMNDVWNNPPKHHQRVHMMHNNTTGDGMSLPNGQGSRNTIHSKDITPLIDASFNDDYYNGQDDDNNTTTTSNTHSDSSIRIRELQQRLLSEELQLYYARITTTIESSNDMSEISAALHGIRTDGGIQELVPFLSRFVGMGLSAKKNLVRTDMCRRLVRVFDAMLDNSNLHLDLQLHQLFTPVGTCVVAKKLSTSPYDDHWSLREEAACCLIKACRIYGDQYTSIKPRVIKLLTQQALRIDRPFPTQYGGIVGISLFGSRAIDAFLLPLARAYWERWEMELDIVTKSGGGGGDALREYELHMCQQALLSAIAIFIQNVNFQEQAKRVDIDSFSEVFGERLIPMIPEPTDYMMAVL